MTGASHKFQFFVVQSVPGKRKDRDGQHNLLLPCTREWGAFTGNVCTVVAWRFMDGNVIFAARAESGQAGGSMDPFLSAPICVTGFPVFTI